MDLQIMLSTRRDESLVEPVGALDYASVPYLRQVLFDLLDTGRRRITIDVARLHLLDAASIRALLFLHRRAEELGGALRVAGARGTVLATLEITGVAKTLDAYDEFDWPAGTRDRHPLDLHEMHPVRGNWPAEATELLDRLRTMTAGDPARRRTRDRVVEVCLPAAHRLARRFTGTTEPLGDLVQVASLGLVKAVDGFDADRGVEFGTYATPTILGEIKRHFRDRASAVRLPRRLQELRMAVNGARDELTQTLSRSPTPADLAEHLDVGEQEIIEVLAAAGACRPASLDTPAGPENLALAEALGTEEPEFGLVDDREALRPLIARLPERERQILTLRFYGNLTQAEIAEYVGLSQMHVSRLLRHALGFLRRHLTG